jgi:hypothetical protein
MVRALLDGTLLQQQPNGPSFHGPPRGPTISHHQHPISLR